MEITETIARKVLSTVDAGLVHGLGVAIPGKMCVEAAVCYALGMEHGDEPSCVGSAVRRFKIRLNDSRWSSDQARTKGMRKIAIAQLGSDTIDQRAFADMVVIDTCRRIVPHALHAAAKGATDEHKVALLGAIPACEAADSIESVKIAALAAKKAAAADAVAYAAAYAAAAAVADAAAAAYAYAAAVAAAVAVAYAAAAAAAAADAYAAAARDEMLNLAADIGLDALKKLNSPGCAFLFLAETTA